MINPTLYSIYFIGVAYATSWCEICLATSHSTRDCAQQGTSEPGMLDRVKTLVSMLLSLSTKSTLTSGTLEAHCQQAEIYRLWNKNKCSFQGCRYRHVCLYCKADHPAIACLKYPPEKLLWGTKYNVFIEKHT